MEVARTELMPPALPVLLASLPMRSFRGSPLPEGWTCERSTVLVKAVGAPAPSARIAGFDFDGTLAKTSLYSQGADDWSFMFGRERTTTLLRRLVEAGYKLVIFTNESSIGRAAKPETRARAIHKKTGRLEGFQRAVGLPMQFFIAAASHSAKPPDPSRKPRAGMWQLLLERHNNDEAGRLRVVPSTGPAMPSFYCGDAHEGNDGGRRVEDAAFAAVDSFVRRANPGRTLKDMISTTFRCAEHLAQKSGPARGGSGRPLLFLAADMKELENLAAAVYGGSDSPFEVLSAPQVPNHSLYAAGDESERIKIAMDWQPPVAGTVPAWQYLAP
eukprot:g8262.t1